MRLKENIDVFDFTLEAAERAQIARLECGKRLGSDRDPLASGQREDRDPQNGLGHAS